MVNKILAIDLGTHYGYCYLDETGIETGNDTYTDFIDWGDKFKTLLEKWKPEIVVLSQTNHFGHWNASRKMLMQAGIAMYIAGKKDIYCVEYNDSSARKAIFGKALKKKEVQQKHPDMQADELDAMILAKGYNKLLNNL